MVSSERVEKQILAIEEKSDKKRMEVRCSKKAARG
jgi:hypothetical protein